MGGNVVTADELTPTLLCLVSGNVWRAVLSPPRSPAPPPSTGSPGVWSHELLGCTCILQERIRHKGMREARV